MEHPVELVKQGIRLNEHLLIKKRRKKERKERMKNKTTTKQNKTILGHVCDLINYA